MDHQQDIQTYFQQHWHDMCRDIARICAVDSQRGKTEDGKPFGDRPYEALMTFQKIAAENGFSMKNYDNACGAVDLAEQSDIPMQLNMLAHLDVVPAGDGWSVTDPFSVRLLDGKLYGRGTADDKGPAIAAFWALKCARDLGIHPRRNARLIVGTDEECGSSDLPHYFSKEPEAPMTFSPDADFPVINIEKGSMSPEFTASWTLPEKGSAEEKKILPYVSSVTGSVKLNVLPGKARAAVEGLSLEQMKKTADQVTAETKVTYELTQKEPGTVYVLAVGTQAHAASPEKGNNALTGLIMYLCALPLSDCAPTRYLHSLLALFPHGDNEGKALGVSMSDEISGKLTLVFSMLDFSRSGFSGRFDCRAPLCATQKNLHDAAERSFARYGITMQPTKMNPPHHVPADSPLVRELLSVYETYTGQKGRCIAIGGGTYVHGLKNGVAFGCSMPGTDNRMHGADEFAVVDELVLSAEMFTQVIFDLCE